MARFKVIQCDTDADLAAELNKLAPSDKVVGFSLATNPAGTHHYTVIIDSPPAP